MSYYPPEAEALLATTTSPEPEPLRTETPARINIIDVVYTGYLQKHKNVNLRFEHLLTPNALVNYIIADMHKDERYADNLRNFINMLQRMGFATDIANNSLTRLEAINQIIAIVARHQQQPINVFFLTNSTLLRNVAACAHSNNPHIKFTFVEHKSTYQSASANQLRNHTIIPMSDAFPLTLLG